MRPANTDTSRFGSESAAARRRRRINAYRNPYRLEIARLTLGWPQLEDLADSFPALLFALATGYASAGQREEALAMIDLGHPLKDVAAVLELPLWLRRLPSEALAQRLPALPSDDEFSAAMLARMPASLDECAAWFDRLVVAYRLVGRDFAMWAAREPRFLPAAMSEDELHWLVAWGWACVTPQSPGRELVRVAWMPAMGWKRAHDEIAIWRKRIELVGALAGPPRDPWFANGRALGHDIVHLDSPGAFVAESAAMENCLDQYATHLAYGRVRVFSVRRDGRPIADFELSLRSDESSMPAIAQVRGPRNRRAPPVVWQAIHAWLGAQPFRTLAASPVQPAASRDALRAFWEPYLGALETEGLTERFANLVLGQENRRGRARSHAESLSAAIRDVLVQSIQRRTLGDAGGG